MTARLCRVARTIGFTFALTLTASARLAAQSQASRITPELRADVIGGRRATAQGALGVNIPAGPYVRVGVLAGVGPQLDSPYGVASRVDVFARFLIDPYRQARWGLSALGGVSLRADADDRLRPEMLVALDLEGPRTRHGVAPAIQLGFGGGVRGGFGLRWGERASR